ncbi:hypothetical protein M8J76_007933 [Diaphorina citri]|nr:hypothetical protein M8J76_007933 [Diaphorina citri]
MFVWFPERKGSYAMLSRHKTPGMPSLVKIVNICLVVISVAQIIHNERVKRDINNYKMETHQSYKIRHILIDHFRAVYMEQHMKFWLEHVKNHFLNTPESNITITIPEAIQKFYTFFNDYKRDVRNYFEQQFLELPREEKKAIKTELINYVNSIPEGERIRLSLVHKCWEMETEIDHAVEDQLESIYDALDSVNIVADVNFYSYLRKLEDPKDMEKKVVTPWTLGVYLHNLNEGLIQHVEKESDYNVAEKYRDKAQERHKVVVDNLMKLNETYGGIYQVNQNGTTTTEKIGTLVV